MRDLLVTLIILGTIPFALRTPWLGVLAWSWLAFMSPHRLCWGFAYGMPFSMLMGLVLIASLFINKEPKKMIWSGPVVLMLLFLIWMFISNFFAHYPDSAWTHYDKVFKVFLTTFIAIMVMQDRQRVHLWVAVIAVSIGFYGIKGGIFTITSGGGDMVLGPRGSFMSTHGEIGMGMAMTLPFLRYLQLHATDPRLVPKPLHRFMPLEMRRFIRLGFGAALFLTGVAILGTQSRGAMLAGAMVAAFLLFKSRQKFRILVLLLLAVPVMLTFMPQSWWDRMDTITAEESEMDESASGRVNAWRMAINMASHEVTGGGFNAWRSAEFAQYAPLPFNVHDAHNSFIEVLGEHGWIGLVLFFTMGLLTWLKASKIARVAKKHQSLLWLSDLARMSQVSMVAYTVSGTFIGQAYFDLLYTVVAIITVCDHVLGKELARIEADAKAPVSNGARGPRAPAPGRQSGQRPGAAGGRLPGPVRPDWKPYGGLRHPPRRPG